MKYWAKVEKLFLTHPDMRANGDAANEPPRLRSFHNGFPSMNRASFPRLYMTLLMAACGKIEMIPLHCIPAFEQALWDAAEAADGGALCTMLDGLDWSQDMDPAVSNRAMAFVDVFLPGYIDSLGVQAMGEHLVMQEAI